MQKPIRVGIVGSGNAAVFHYASYPAGDRHPGEGRGRHRLDRNHSARSLPTSEASGPSIPLPTCFRRWTSSTTAPRAMPTNRSPLRPLKPGST